MAKQRFGQFGVKNKSSYYFLSALTIVFADILGNGNLNLLYFATVLLLLGELKVKSVFFKDMVVYYLPFCLVVLLQIVFGKTQVSPIRVFVFAAKIFLCVVLLSYVKNNFYKIDSIEIAKWIASFFSVFLIIAILTINYPIMWRLNDSFNNFSKTRLQFFYSEPSVLGLWCGLFIIILLWHLLRKGAQLKIVFPMMVFGIVLVLTSSMSGIVYTAVGSAVLFFFESFSFPQKQETRKRAFRIYVLGALIVFAIVMTENPISNRLIAILQGTDGSFNFRWTAAINTFEKIMKSTAFWGIGIGNMNTQDGLAILNQYGLDYKMANSFLYFATENGIWGILYICHLLAVCLRSCLKKKDEIFPLKIALWCFAIIMQVAGGYFTDPMVWIIYGIVCARSSREQCTSIKQRVTG